MILLICLSSFENFAFKKVSTISTASPSPTTLAPIANIFALLCSIVALAEKQSWHNAALIPFTLFAAMDILAIGILSYAANKNISIPEQLAVLGFDNSPLCSYTVPALSTFQEDSDNISFALIKLARKKLQNNREIKHELYCPQFIERSSV